MSTQTLEVLYDRLIDGEAHDEDLNQLNQLLTVPENRRQLAQLLTLEGGLSELLQEESADIPSSVIADLNPLPPTRTTKSTHSRQRARGSRKLHSSKKLSYLLITLVIVCVFIISFFILPTQNTSHSSTDPTVITHSSGQWQDKNGQWHTPLQSTGVVKNTELKGPIALKVPLSGQFELGTNCAVTFLNSHHLYVKSGEIKIKAATRNNINDTSLRITTPHGEAEVLGAEFTLHVTDSMTSCQVQYGLVALRSLHGEEHLLNAGEQARVESAKTSSKHVHKIVVTKYNAQDFLGTDQQGRISQEGIRPALHEHEDRLACAIAGDLRPLGLNRVSLNDILEIRYSMAQASKFWVVLVVHDENGRWLSNWQMNQELPAAQNGEHHIPLHTFKKMVGNSQLNDQKVHKIYFGWPQVRLDDTVLHQIMWHRE